MQLPRSKLFVPGNRPERMRKAVELEADALSLDLEDAVPAGEKAAARAAVAAFLRERSSAPPRQQAWVRVNSRDSGELVADILALQGLAFEVINVPKAEHPRDVHVVEDLVEHLEREGGAGFAPGAIAIVPTIETAAGLRNALAIAQASPRVVALQLGAGDLRKSTGIRATVEALRAVRVMLSLAAAEAGVHALDSAYVDIADTAGFEADAMDARSLGFRGKSCIHPSQVPLANRVFRPTDEEIAHSLKVVEAARVASEKGVGAFTVDGRMVDAPFIRRAERILELATKLGLVAMEERTIQ
jgi:citrate lyase subunit beta/citryl-CoA lyase